MKTAIKTMSEMCALGAISEEQLKEVCKTTSEYEEALEYAKEYADEYNKCVVLAESYAEKLLDARDVIMLTKTFLDASRVIHLAKVSTPESWMDSDLEMIENVMKYHLDSEIKSLLDNGDSLESACYEWDI